MSNSGRASVGGARWLVPLATTLLWALVALSTGWWGLKMSSIPAEASLPLPMPVRSPEPMDPVAVGRLLGAQPATTEGAGAVFAPSLSSRFVLMGVVADLSGSGTALLSVDGQPPKPYRVGALLADGVVLQSVQGRQALIGPSLRGPAAATLELPPLPP